MKTHIAEYVSPGHPDRLADAIVESVVDLAVSRDPEALVGVECAVHTDHVFIDGRIAAGRGHCAVTHGEIEDLARDVYKAAGYGGLWKPAPEELRVIQNVCSRHQRSWCPWAMRQASHRRTPCHPMHTGQ